LNAPHAREFLTLHEIVAAARANRAAAAPVTPPGALSAFPLLG